MSAFTAKRYTITSGPKRLISNAVDLGAVFQGETNVELTPVLPTDSPINTNPLAREALQILLDREEEDLQDDIGDYDLYPVVSIGISYRF